MSHKGKKSRLFLAVVLAMGSAATVAEAQDGDRPGSQDAQFKTWIAPFLEQLDITEEQKPKFLAIQKAMTSKWAELQKMPPQERKPKQEAFYKARFAELEQLLTPEQMAKYREIRASRWRSQNRTPRARPAPIRGNSRPLPPADYSGHDIVGIEGIVDEVELAEQSWRKEAEERIAQLRKANLQIRVVDASGNPLPGVSVHVEQQRHAFRFGGVVSGPSMHESAPGRRPRRIPPERYKEMFLELGFNTAGFNSYLKYKRRPISEPHLPALFAWFQEHDIPVRGHCLIWPGGIHGNFMPVELSEMVYVRDPTINWRSTTKATPRDALTPAEQQAVRGLCERMVKQASQQWPVCEWDVINETRDNHIVQDLVGRDVMVDWFNIADQNTIERKALLYLNENRVISDPAPGDVTRNMRLFEDEVRYLIDNGAPISALGFQSRFARKIPPETVYKRLEYFAEFNLPIAATEFEMKDTIGDEFERAAITEQVMTVLFSHRLVNGIYAWSLLAQDQGGSADRAILYDDAQLKPRGKVWMYLMKNRWWTDESLTTDANGTVELRGFKGDYMVTVAGDSAGSMKLHLDDDREAEMTAPSAGTATESAPATEGQVPNIIGRKGFVHVERTGGVWFMVNAEGERFVPTGMNHVGPMSRFAPYNRDFWLKQFGPEVFMAAGRQVDWQGPGVKRWMERIAKDHKDYGFNTLAFHHPPTMPSEYCNQLKLYYFGKIRMSHVHARRARTMSPDKKFPDVFDPTWLANLDRHVERFTARHKNAKYLLGYSYDDLPAYTIHNLERRIEGFEHHPWILDIISKPGLTEGKSVWIDVLKEQYPSAAGAGDMYGLVISDWDAFAQVTEWGLPKDPKQGSADQAMMNAKIVEAYLKAHHDAIRRHDPNHLILGDKIQNARPQPDWVWEIVKEYVDVIVVQDYDFFTPEHERKLRHIYSVTGRPIINGDHSYGVLRPHMHAVKGVKVDSAEAKGQEYATYLRGIMNLPFMLGWQTCGYLETWEGTSDATGKQQTGYFDPFGRPIKEALSHVKAANGQAVQWHERAESLDDVYSDRRRQQ